MMETLYDLLGALPRDDAEGLRAAFRRAVKGAHPDLNPGDPDAADKFRQIMRASEILGDEEQRAAYDHLLDLAHREQKQHATAKTVHRFATSVIALVVVAGIGLGGWFAYQHIPQISAPPKHLAVQTAPAVARIEIASPDAPSAKSEPAKVSSEAVVPVVATPTAAAESASPAGPPLDIVPNDARIYHERGIFAYRSGDFDGAIADFDRAIQLDPKFSAAYIDRGVVLYRLQRFEQAYADITHAKRIENTKRARAAQAAAKKPKPPQPATAFGFPPLFQRRTAKLE